MPGANGAGWVKLWRKAESVIVNAGRWQLFSWLLVKAAYASKRVVAAGDPSQSIDLAPGQLVVSHRELAETLGRTRSGVQRDLAWMASQRMVSLKPLGWGTLVTVCNWNLYQDQATERVDAAFIQRVLDDFNAALADAGVSRRIQGGKEFARLVTARVNQDGATFDQFQHVHRVKSGEWAGTDQEVYIRPSTLYAPSHWADYRDQAAGTSTGPWQPPTLTPRPRPKGGRQLRLKGDD